MKVYTLQRTQCLPISRTEAWEFFSNPRNLSKITPPSLAFECLDEFDEMRPGMMLMYRVRPLPAFRTTWVTEISHVQQPDYFVDEQRVGPYKLWHHQHHFSEIPGGVEMRDEIHYALPFGWLGRIFHKPLVLPELEKIFRFRQTTLEEMFGRLD